MIEHFMQYYRQEFLFLKDNNITEIVKGVTDRLDKNPDSGQFLKGETK